MPATRFIACPTSEPWQAAGVVVKTLISAGFETWLVGGCVRDLLLGHPVHDVDVTTAAHPDQVQALFPHTIAVGKAFGVITVVHDHGHTEVATFRSDGAYVNGRHPESVHYGSVHDDVERRDFTINALLFDPVTGTVVDHVGGLADLAERNLRTVGNAQRRFGEDRLRILRALRFAARLDLSIDDDTWAALCGETLVGLSAERLVQEWEKALQGPHPERWLDLLAASGHLPALHPQPTDVSALARALQRLPVHASLALRQAVWLHQVPHAQAINWLEQLPGSRHKRQHVSWLLAHVDPGEIDGWPLAKRRRLLQHAGSAELLDLWQSCVPDHSAVPILTAMQHDEQAADSWVPLLRAADLLAIGWRPGPHLGAVLRSLEDAQLEGRASNRDQALALAQQLLDRLPGH